MTIKALIPLPTDVTGDPCLVIAGLKAEVVALDAENDRLVQYGTKYLDENKLLCDVIDQRNATIEHQDREAERLNETIGQLVELSERLQTEVADWQKQAGDLNEELDRIKEIRWRYDDD